MTVVGGILHLQLKQIKTQHATGLKGNAIILCFPIKLTVCGHQTGPQ